MATMKDNESTGWPTDAELVHLIRTGSDPQAQGTALVALVERAPRSLARTLSSVAVDGALDPSVRALAIGALAHRPTPGALDALRSATGDDDALVARRAIERLGKVGDADDIEVLRGLAVGDANGEAVIRSAKEFLSYRHRLGDYTLSVPRGSLAATTDEATAIRTGAPTAKMRSALELLPAQSPGVDIDPLPARRIECGSSEFGLHLVTPYRREAMASLVERQGLPAVITVRNLETGRFQPAYYLMTDPIRHNRFRIAGVRSSGRVALIGNGEIDDSVVRFELYATELPIDHPLTVTGSYDTAAETVRFDVARSEPRFDERQQRRRRQPRPITAPRS